MMMRLTAAVFLALLVAAGVFAMGETALACSKPQDWTIEKEFKNAALVFRALVTRTELNPQLVEAGGRKQRILIDVSYEVIETFKGSPRTGGIVSTHTAILGGCGAPMLAGQEFLLFVIPFGDDVKEMPDLAAQSQGMISIFGTDMLWGDSKSAKETLAKIRALAGRRKGALSGSSSR